MMLIIHIVTREIYRFSFSWKLNHKISYSLPIAGEKIIQGGWGCGGLNIGLVRTNDQVPKMWRDLEVELRLS